MGLLRLSKLPTAGQLLGCELLNGLEHGEARIRRIRAGRLLKANQTRIVERFEAVQDRQRQMRPEVDDRPRRIEGPAAGEDRQTPEEGLLRWIEEVVAPGDRPPQCLLSLRQVPATSGEEREPAVEPCQDRLRWEEPYPRRRQLDGKRETIQAT